MQQRQSVSGNEVEMVRNRAEKLSLEVRERTASYIAAAFGLVAGLAWNDAIITFIDTFFPTGSNTVLAKFIYAIVITIVAVVGTTYLLKIFKKKETVKE